MGDGREPTKKPSLRRALFWALAGTVLVVLVVGVHDTLRPRTPVLAPLGLDFRAFYCAGEAAAEGADPYRLEPLRACEHRVQPDPLFVPLMVTPAPFPGYTIAVFETFSRLPYGAAKALWQLIMVASLFFAASLLADATGISAVTLLLALTTVDGVESWLYGQMAPLSVAALCAAGACVALGRHAWAAVAAAVALIEPHLAVPSVVALFIWLPRTRLVLLAAAAFLAVCSVVAIGAQTNVEYFSTALPRHALAEVWANDQYSLTWVAHLAGASDGLALRIGAISYIAMCAIGVAIAKPLATALATDELLVFFPAAAALLGGSFIHDSQMCAALPAAFVLAARARRLYGVAWLALTLLVVPPMTWWRSHIIGPITVTMVSLAAILALAWKALEAKPIAARFAAALAWTLAVTSAAALLAFAIHRLPNPPAPSSVHLAYPSATLQNDAFASDNWAVTIKMGMERSPASNLKLVLRKSPVWIGLTLVVIVGCAQLRPLALRTGLEATSKQVSVPTPTSVAVG